MKKSLIITFLFFFADTSIYAQKILDPCFTSLEVEKYSSVEENTYNEKDLSEGVRKSDSLVLRLDELLEWTGSKWKQRESNNDFSPVIPPPYFHPGRAILVGNTTGEYTEWSKLKIKPQFFALKLDKPLEPGVETKFVFAYTNLVHSWGWPLNYDTTGYFFTPEIYCDSLPNIYDNSEYNDHYMPEDTNRKAFFLGRLRSSGYKQWVIDTLTVRLPANVKNQNWLIVYAPIGENGIFYNICSIRLPTEIEPGKNIVLRNVFFETDKSDLLPTSFDDLNGLISYLKKNTGMKIAIRGYTDNTGTQDKNLSLSQARAKAVSDYLISKGINKLRVSYKGYGSANPITSNDTEEGKAKNRRVEFKIENK